MAKCLAKHGWPLMLAGLVVGCSRGGKSSRVFVVNPENDASSESPSGPSDAGTDGDAGLALAGANCAPLPAHPVIDAPSDFSPRWGTLIWSERCTHIVLSLGEGSCRYPSPHRIEFSFGAEALHTLAFPRGDLRLPSPHLSVVYQRPAPLSPEGAFGSCTEIEGILNIDQTLAPVSGSRFQAAFQLTLPPCAGTVGTPQDVIGNFDATLPESDCED